MKKYKVGGSKNTSFVFSFYEKWKGVIIMKIKFEIKFPSKLIIILLLIVALVVIIFSI